jgi:hypothetical protein
MSDRENGFAPHVSVITGRFDLKKIFTTLRSE